MAQNDPILIMVDHEESDAFAKALEVADASVQKLDGEYHGISISGPEKVEKFGAETFAEFAIPFVQHVGPLIATLLGYWLTRSTATIIIGDIQIKDVQMKHLPSVVAEIKKLQKTRQG